MNCNPQAAACFERSVNHGYAVEFHVLALIAGAVGGLAVQVVMALLPMALIFVVLYANFVPWAETLKRRLVLVTWDGKHEVL